jgi:hypothetical protein
MKAKITNTTTSDNEIKKPFRNPAILFSAYFSDCEKAKPTTEQTEMMNIIATTTIKINISIEYSPCFFSINS